MFKCYIFDMGYLRDNADASLLYHITMINNYEVKKV